MKFGKTPSRPCAALSLTNFISEKRNSAVSSPRLITLIAAICAIGCSSVFATNTGDGSPADHAHVESAKVLWDEAESGDLSSVFGKPTRFLIEAPGAYMIRVKTGPMTPVRVESAPPMPPVMTEMLGRLDANKDGKLQSTEAGDAFSQNFETYDINGDGELEFQSEIGQFVMTGDGHDLIDFDQADGRNLVAIIVTQYDSGGELNKETAFVVMDHRSGSVQETRGVAITDKDMLREYSDPLGKGIAAGRIKAGEEIYSQFDLWKAYRRNDMSTYFRIGEGQATSSTELIFVFE